MEMTRVASAMPVVFLQSATEQQERWKDWYIPLSQGNMSLREAKASLDEVGMQQSEVPLIIQLIENPRFQKRGLELFHGAADLKTHDYIHILLGRGLLMKDEAFVIGFTMGSTGKVSALEEKAFGVFTRYLYPKSYRFGPEDFEVYRDALRLATIAHCPSLADVDYERLLDLSLSECRKLLGIDEDLLRAYYRIERQRFPGEKECHRLLD